MNLVVLGSGTATPHPKRSSAAFWLETAGGTVLLDMGAPALHRMVQEGLDWATLDAIWLSHFHLDHCCGIAAYLFAARHSPETRSRTKPLRIVGGRGTRGLIERFDAVNGYKLFDQPFPVEVVEVDPLQSFEIVKGVDAVSCSTPHTPESLAIRIGGEAESSIVYTSDTGFGKEIAAFAKGVGLLITEASFFTDKPVELHLNLAEAMYIVRHARPGRAMLTHFYPEWDEVDFAAEVAAFDPACEVIQAFDGLRLEI